MNRLVFLLLTACLVMFAGCDSAESDGSASALDPQTSSTDPANVTGDSELINLTSLCQGWWLVDNLTDEPQAFTWEHLSSESTGAGTVRPSSQTFFKTPHVLGDPDDPDPNTTILRDAGGDHDVSASNNGTCETMSGFVYAVPDGATDASEGAGLENVLVQVFFASEDHPTNIPAGQDTTASDGSYSIDLPHWTSESIPYVDYTVIVPDEAGGLFNEDLYEFYDLVAEPEQPVRLNDDSKSNVNFGFDGDDAAMVAELERLNDSGREPWSARDLRKAFDRARKGKPCHNAVLCRDELLDVTRYIVDDPNLADDEFFGLSFPYLGPDLEGDGNAYSDQELLEWGYQVLKDVPQGPQDENARLYSLVFACQINFLANPELEMESESLDRAIQAYLEADVLANPPSGMVLPLRSSVLAQRAGGGGGGTIEVARTYLGGGGGGTIEE